MTSALALQSALALLIRYPRKNRGVDFLEFSRKFDLSLSDQKILAQMAAHPLVTKYGRNMSRVRWGMVHRCMPFSQRFIPEKVSDLLWEDHFEPGASRIRADELALSYFDFLLDDSGAQDLLKNSSPEFISELLLYEKTILLFRQNRLKAKPPRGARLRHMNFKVFGLKYEIPKFVILARRLRENLQPEVHFPRKAPSTYLLLGKEGGGFRPFQIDDESGEFLIAEADGRPAEPPPNYVDLVDLGLCTGASLTMHDKSLLRADDPK